jgi:Uma2 family endonuclease
MRIGAAKTPVTAEELPALSARVSVLGKRTELVRGDLVVMASAGGRHGQVAHTVAFFIGVHVRDRSLGRVFAAETGFILRRDPDTVRAPDVAFVAAERLGSEETPAGFLEPAPDLAVEVVSPGDSAAAVRDKIQDWLKAGTRLVWVVYPETRSVVVHRQGHPAETLSEADTLNAVPVLRDFTVQVRELFA